MTFSINSLAVGESYSFYYTKEIKNLLESHLEFLKNHPESRVVQITPNIAYKYEGDFYGLLMTLRIPQQYHWITMRMNDLTSPTDMPENKIAFIQPSFDVVDQIISMYRTSRSIPR